MSNFTPEQIEQFLEEFFTSVGRRQYVGARYVPVFGRKDETSIEWDNTKPYEPLTIVLYQGTSFTSRTYVPEGVDINNTAYWANTGNYNAQIEQYRQELVAMQETVRNLDTAVSDMQTTVSGVVESVEDLGEAVGDNQTAIESAQAAITATNEYIEKYVSKVFDTVADMLQDETLTEDSVCKTLGFYSKNDNGGGYYVIDAVTDSNPTTHETATNLYAHLILKDVMYADAFGIDSENDCASLLQFALDNCGTVLLSAKKYIISTVTIPRDKHLIGTFSRNYNLDNCTVIEQASFNESPIVLRSGCLVSGLKFIQPNLRATSKESVNVQYEPCIYGTSLGCCHISYIIFMGCYIGINLDGAQGAIGMMKIDNIYGCCLHRVFMLDRVLDFLAIRDCAFNVPGIIYTSSNFDLEYSYLRYSGGIIEVGKADYPSFENIQVFTARYGIILKSTEYGFCRNFTINNCSFDSVGTGIICASGNIFQGMTVTNTIFKTQKGISSTLTNDANIGRYAVVLYGGDGFTFSNCKFYDINISCFYLNNAMEGTIVSNLFRNMNILEDSDGCIARIVTTRCVFSNNSIFGNGSRVKGISAQLDTDNQKMIVADNLLVDFAQDLFFDASVSNATNRARILAEGNMSTTNIPKYKEQGYIYNENVVIGQSGFQISDLHLYKDAYMYMYLDFSYQGSVGSTVVLLSRLPDQLSGHIRVQLDSNYIDFRPDFVNNTISPVGSSFASGTSILCFASFFGLKTHYRE